MTNDTNGSMPQTKSEFKRTNDAHAFGRIRQSAVDIRLPAFETKDLSLDGFYIEWTERLSNADASAFEKLCSSAVIHGSASISNGTLMIKARRNCPDKKINQIRVE